MGVRFMQEALKEAQKASEEGEVPIGAVIAHEGKIIARGHNTREASKNPLHHAEILILEETARRLGNWRLDGCTLYVTLEPCPMCLGALLQARVSRLVYGCSDPKREKDSFPSIQGKQEIRGNNHIVQIAGNVLEKECATLLKEFFKLRRL